MSDSETQARQRAVKKSRRGVAWALLRTDTSVIIATLILFVVFAASSKSFLTSYNLFNVARTSALNLFISLGQVLVIIVGGMNLSLGNIGGLSAIIAGYCMQILGWSGGVAAAAALCVGGLCGLLNGILIIRLKLSSFVVTLATAFIFQGMVNGISKGYPFTKISTALVSLGRNGVFGVPYLFILMIIACLIVWYLFKYTVLGRMLLATGGSEPAARMSGIKTDKMTIVANVLSGFLAALAAMLWVSRLGSAPAALGGDWLIVSFAVAVIGGTALRGGEIVVAGLFASSIMIALIRNGLVMLNVDVYFEQTFLGLVILFAVAIESARMRYSTLRRL